MTTTAPPIPCTHTLFLSASSPPNRVLIIPLVLSMLLVLQVTTNATTTTTAIILLWGRLSEDLGALSVRALALLTPHINQSRMHEPCGFQHPASCRPVIQCPASSVLAVICNGTQGLEFRGPGRATMARRVWNCDVPTDVPRPGRAAEVLQGEDSASGLPR